MSELPNYSLKGWQNSELLKEAAVHLRDQPDYVKMDPAAEAEMTSFCHAVRRALMKAKEDRGYGPYAILEMEKEYGIILTTADHSRYSMYIHGFTFTFIMDTFQEDR
jgi:hypothetical protein